MDMGTDLDSRGTAANLPVAIQDLLKNPASYDFVAAVRLLHAWLSQQKLPLDWPHVKLAATLSMAFPKSDVGAVQTQDGQAFTLLANFLAIYGTTSPLPNYYTEALFSDANQDNHAVQDFLGLFQHRLYQTYYDYYVSRQLNDSTTKSSQYLQKIYALAGVGCLGIQSSLPRVKQLRYACLLARKHRTYQGLTTLLADYLDATVTIEAYSPCRRAIAADQYALLGQQNTRLGENLHIGQSYVSVRNNLHLNISHLNLVKFKRLLPDQELSLAVKELVKTYVLKPQHIRLSLLLDADQHIPTALGEHQQSILGQDIWLGQAAPVSSLTLSYQLC